MDLNIFFNDFGMRSRIELMIPGMELGCVLKAGENLDVIQEKIDDLP